MKEASVAEQRQGWNRLLLRGALRANPDAHLTPARGTRAAVATLLPLVIIELVGLGRLGSSAAAGTLLGALMAAFCDLGPSLHIRTRAMGAGILLGTLLMLLGSAIGGPWWVAVPALGIATFLSGLLPIYGPVVAQVGTILTVVFALALGRASGPAAALPTALGFLFGGTFMLVLVVLSSLLRRAIPPTPQPPAAPPPAQPRQAAPTPRLVYRSPALYFALLRAVGTGLVAGLAWGSGVLYPQWAPIVVITSVRPDQMAAILLTTQRVIGTILGAGLADVILLLNHEPLVLVVLAIAGVFLAFTVLDLSYTLFVFFLTFLTLLLLNIPGPGPSYVVLRVVATVIGGAAALGVSLLAAWLTRHVSAAARPASEPPSDGAVT
jgi:hypothetical protein